MAASTYFGGVVKKLGQPRRLRSLRAHGLPEEDFRLGVPLALVDLLLKPPTGSGEKQVPPNDRSLLGSFAKDLPEGTETNPTGQIRWS